MALFFAIAIIITTTRIVLNVRAYQRLRPDDMLLLFACICLTIGTAFSLKHVGNLYFDEIAELNLVVPTYFFNKDNFMDEFSATLNSYRKLYYTFPALTWTTIFFVKFAYLYFFRRLVDRVAGLVLYWKFVVAACILSFPICIVSIYISCPKTGIELSVF